ncbi:MAG TPA: queuosine precursor transporter [Phycisphaerae bacterium]|nr:queuosine precursor transporter [Phycisphaerae bacterium]
MLRTDFGKFKYLGLLAALNITFLLVSNFTAARIISICGIGVSVTILYFPLTYLIADILTEVYGYSRARSIIWLSIFCSVVGAAVAGAQLLVPSAVFFKGDTAYQQIFSSTPKIAIAGLLAVLVGDFCNSYVLAKIKIWNKGKYLWFRFVASTIVGEGLNTLIFYGIALYGVLPNNLLLQSIFMGWTAKTLVEVVMLPVTYPIVRFLKRIEGIDYYDYQTNFNPFITDDVI